MARTYDEIRPRVPNWRKSRNQLPRVCNAVKDICSYTTMSDSLTEQNCRGRKDSGELHSGGQYWRCEYCWPSKKKVFKGNSPLLYIYAIHNYVP